MSGDTSAPEAPKLARRSANRHSAMKSGRTIGERREKLETASERAAARDKVKRHQRRRVIFTLLGFALAAVAIVLLGHFLMRGSEEIIAVVTDDTPAPIVYTPTIEVVDEDAGSTDAQLTSRMREYIGQVEADLRELGFAPVKAVIPSGAIREVDFYLEGHPGFIKFVTDRGAGVSTEDASRMLKYLTEQGITDFTYIDVRVDGRAYWK